MTATYTIVLALSAFLFSFAGTALLLWLLPRLHVLDVPNARSNHANPTPRGGGLAVIIPAAGFLTVAGAHSGPILGTLALMLISFMDDRKPLPVRMRLAVQAAAVAFALSGFDYGLVFQGILPWWLDRLAAGIIWLWFINLYNFMDGIDEITALHTVSVMAGLALLTMIDPGVKNFLAVDGAIIGGAVLGFWLFNRHPARIFLGDCGSIPLGFLVGFLLLVLAAEGDWHAALILPAYYLTDATVTLLRRLIRKEKVWQAHSEHAYQTAVRHGRRHDTVARYILALNLALAVLAVISVPGGAAAWVSLAAAYVFAGGLMYYFSKPVQTLLPPAHVHPA